MYSIEDCNHNDSLRIPGRAGVTPGRGGGTKTLTLSPNGTKEIQYFQKDQMHCGSLNDGKLAGRKKQFLMSDWNIVPAQEGLMFYPFTK